MEIYTSERERKTFADFLIKESVLVLTTRLQLLIKNAFDYKINSFNESFSVTELPRTGKNGMQSKYVLRYNTLMKSKIIKHIKDFENSWLDTILKLNVQFKEIPDSDVEFIEYLDDFLDRVFILLVEKIQGMNSLRIKKRFIEIEKNLSLKNLKRMTTDFTLFVESLREIFNEECVRDYVSIIGAETKRIMKNDFSFSSITLDISTLEESGCSKEI